MKNSMRVQKSSLGKVRALAELAVETTAGKTAVQGIPMLKLDRLRLVGLSRSAELMQPMRNGPG